MPDWNDGWQLGTPDLVVRMAGRLHRAGRRPRRVPHLRASRFRCRDARYVRAIEFRPGNARVVHHANLGVDRTRSSRQLDARDPEPGYVGSMVRDARYPEGQLLGWTPGQAPHPSPDGMPWRLEPGSDLVVQLHLQPTGKPEPLQVSVGFFFTDAPPARTPIGLRLGSETIDIPAGERELRRRRSLRRCRSTSSSWPSSRTRTTSRDGWRRAPTLPDGTTRPLIAIADWDFRWQDVYRYAAPIALPKGTTISMRYTYDNSAANPRNPHRPPARVVWGQNTSDEMGDLWLQVVPRADADVARSSTADFRRKAHRRRPRGVHEAAARPIPTNPLRHDAVGELYLEAGQSRRGDRSDTGDRCGLNPESAPTHYNLGYRAVGARAGGTRRSREFRGGAPHRSRLRAGAQQPGRAAAAGRHADEALAHFDRAVALRPDNVEARRTSPAAVEPGSSGRGRRREFRAALTIDARQRCRRWPVWPGSARPRRIPRCGTPRRRSARRTCRRRRSPSIATLDALAAAYASAGRFEEAVSAARSGIDARGRGRPARGRRPSSASGSSCIKQGQPFRHALIQLFR